MIEVRVPRWPESLWFVPDNEALEVLASEGISRGRIWTAAELGDIAALSPEETRIDTYDARLDPCRCHDHLYTQRRRISNRHEDRAIVVARRSTLVGPCAIMTAR